MLTIGHSTLPVETFLHILEENGCEVLADIRKVPRSGHNPQFAQEALAASLARAGMAYTWRPGLGGLRRPLKDSINAGWRNTSFRGYADYMQTTEFAAALDGLVEHSPGRRTVLMCAEAVPWRCHRSLVGDALLARGIAVEDIFYDAQGRSHRKPHSLTYFARVEGTRVTYPLLPEQPLLAGLEPGS